MGGPAGLDPERGARAFQFRALDPAGGEVAGTILAAGREGALAQLHARHLLPIEIAAETGSDEAPGARTGGRPRLTGEAAARFARRLQLLAEAGVTLERALTLMASPAGTEAARAAARVRGRVAGGTPLSDGLAAELGPVAAAFARAGEQAGRLPEALDRLATLLEARAGLRSALLSALAYPAALLALSLVAAAVLLLVVVPQFAELFRDAGRALPPASAALLAVADALPVAIPLLTLAGAGLVLGVAAWRRSPAGAASWDGFALRLPLVRLAAWERVARVAGAALSAALPLDRALELARDAAERAPLRASLSASLARVRGGEPLSRALASAAPPASLAELIAVGEATGRLGPLLTRGAELLDREAREGAKRLAALAGPVLTLLLGAAIGGLILLLVQAVTDVYDLAP